MIQNVTPGQTVRIIEIVREPTAPIDMIQVSIAAFGLTGLIMGSAVVAGLLAGALYIWY
nr:hypothetical protein [Acidobacteriota bacterium]